jgi:hypothetical protein
MLIEVTGNLVRDNEFKEGRFFINSEYIAVLGANGSKANFHMASGLTIYSDANIAEVIKKIDNAKLYGD